MTDSRLRELERRWKETGAAEDEAAFFRERWRTGELTRALEQLGDEIGEFRSA